VPELFVTLSPQRTAPKVKASPFRSNSEEVIPLRRGAQIVQGIKSASYLEGKGIEEIRSVTVDIDGSVGDGSKLAALLASEFMTKGPHSLGVRAEQHLSR
jgi:hypothetical protein